MPDQHVCALTSISARMRHAGATIKTMQPTAVAAALIASAAVLMTSTPLANADPQDDAYLHELGAHGIAHYPPDTLIKAGHLVCAYLSAGAAPWQTQNGLMGTGIAPQDIDAVVNAASRTYCHGG